MARKVPDHVQKIFDKYTVNFVRRLNKDTALRMFKDEFKLDDERSALMFETFDTDHNDILSAPEFFHFYTSFGYDANEYLDKFDDMCKSSPNPDNPTADPDPLFDFLKDLKTLNGQSFSETDVKNIIITVAGEEEKSVNRAKFIQLIRKIKTTRSVK